MTDPLVIPRTRRMGPFTVSRLAFGCWRLPGATRKEAEDRVTAAVSAGITLFDTAPIYGAGQAETVLGEVLSAAPDLRDRMTLVTKAGITRGVPYDSTRQTLIDSVDASLGRLQTDRIDTLLIHRPDLLTPWAEVAETLDHLIETGKVLSAGVSNFTTHQTRALASRMTAPLVATQPEFSALHTDPLTDGTLDLAQETDMAPMAWSPLAGGRLATGADDPQTTRTLAAIDQIATRTGAARDAIALAWVLAHPAAPIALLGTQNPDRIRAAAAAYDTGLTRPDWYAILEASRGQRMP